MLKNKVITKWEGPASTALANAKLNSKTFYKIKVRPFTYVNNQKVDKPGTAVAEDAAVEVRGNALKYVSRGGLKLEKAMQVYPIVLTDTVCIVTHNPPKERITALTRNRSPTFSI